MYLFYMPFQRTIYYCVHSLRGRILARTVYCYITYKQWETHMQFKKILVAVDDSEYSSFACQLAAQLSMALPGEELLYLLHCTPLVPNLIGGEQRSQLIREHQQEAEQILDAAAKSFESTGNSCQKLIRVGDPAEHIVSAAEELGCDLIITGTHGSGKVQNLLLGSVSSDVIEQSHIPVLLAARKK